MKYKSSNKKKRQMNKSETAALVHRWLLDLLSVYTPAGQEAKLLPILRPILKGLGASVEFRRPAPGRLNVLASWGTPQVLFSTHLDVVPEKLSIHESNGAIYGRGACDAKGQIVAQLLAIRSLLEQGYTDLAWLGVCGEETDSLGARDALAWKNRFKSCRALINGEPTDLKCATGQRGALHLRLRCRGKAAHSGSPELGHSATMDLVDWLGRLRSLKLPSDPNLGPEIWNLATLKGGLAPNIIADLAEADILTRTIPHSRFLAEIKSTCPPSCGLEILLDEPPDQYPTLSGFDRGIMPFGSDTPQLRALIPDRTAVLVGPGSIRVAHTDREHILIEDLLAGAELNQKIALHFLKA